MLPAPQLTTCSQLPSSPADYMLPAPQRTTCSQLPSGLHAPSSPASQRTTCSPAPQRTTCSLGNPATGKENSGPITGELQLPQYLAHLRVSGSHLCASGPAYCCRRLQSARVRQCGLTRRGVDYGLSQDDREEEEEEQDEVLGSHPEHRSDVTREWKSPLYSSRSVPAVLVPTDFRVFLSRD